MTGSRWPSEDIELRGMLNVARNILALFLLACFFVLFLF